MVLSPVFALLLSAELVSAACSRQSLITARDAYFSGSPKLAAGAKFALSQKFVPQAQMPKLTDFTERSYSAFG